MSEEQWHLDKRVPISLIGAMIVQTAAIIWFISSLNSRVSTVEAEQARYQISSAARQDAITQNTIKVAVINQNLAEIQRSLGRIEKQLEDRNE